MIFDITSGSTEEFVIGDGGIVDFTISGPGRTGNIMGEGSLPLSYQ